MIVLALVFVLVVSFALGGVTGMMLPVMVVYGLPLAFAVLVACAAFGVGAAVRQRWRWKRSDSEAAQRALANWCR